MGLTILVTGAGGFLGRAVVAAGLARGHDVTALVRRPAPLPAGSVALVHDLDHGAPDLSGVDAVVHCAASLTGDSVAQDRDTVQATRTLAQAIEALGIPPRLVLAGSLAVYDYERLPPGSEITEATACADIGRDAYSRAKLAQEALVAELPSVWLLRFGIIYGPGRSWNAHIGAGLGPVLVRIGGAGQLPLVHVQDCANAMIQAAESPVFGARALNIVGDDLPDRTRFLTAHRAGGWPRLTVPLPWQALLALATGIKSVPGLPGLLRPGPLKARMMPLRYSNAAVKAALGWTPQVPFETGMANALRGVA